MGAELAVGMWAHVVLVGRGIGMFRAHVEIECLALEESLATDLTGVGHLLLVAFHVVVHGVLLLLHDAAGGADEVTGFISNVLAHFKALGRGQLESQPAGQDSIFCASQAQKREAL